MPKYLRLDLLLVMVPIAGYLHFATQHHVAAFICSCIAIIPIAGWMGKATEHLAERTGEGVGGLLNATFGNAAELIIALMALYAGMQAATPEGTARMHEIVKASITGSIIGNLLLVLGASLFIGGLRHRVQRFNPAGARTYGTILLLAATALVMPAVFHHVGQPLFAAAAQTSAGPVSATAAAIAAPATAALAASASAAAPVTAALLSAERDLSLEIAIILFITYLGVLWFSLRSHKQLFTGAAAEAAKVDTGDDAGHGHGHRIWPAWLAVTVLLVATAMVAVVAEWMIASVEHAGPALGLNHVFLGVIVVAVVGNAAEHSTAILMALKNRMDLAIGIALGSSVQIALFVAPVLVFASYAFGTPLDLVFSPLEVLAIVATVWITEQVISDGESNWLEGFQLLGLYAIIGMVFYLLPH